MRWQILKKIRVKNPDSRLKEIIKILFLNRGLKTKKQQKEFLNPKDPYKLKAKDVDISSLQLNKALKIIKAAIKNKEKIIVYGDYDADGVCATAILWEALFKLKANVLPFIPKREEGYGLKIARLKKMADDGVKLIITVDQGIVQTKQVAFAKKIGLKTIITDHHLPTESKPMANALIHTTSLSGSGVAWFLAKHFQPKIGLDLVTIGTITDMVPLIGPNRSIVKFGLKNLGKTKRVGLLVLYQQLGLVKEKISPYEVGFIIGPRLNASGRMEDPMESLRLICTQDQRRASDLAREIDSQNRERQLLTSQTFLQARQIWLQQDGRSNLIFIQDQSFEQGVIGLVARQLMEEFYRPAIVLAPQQDHWVASARSIQEFNLIEAIRECANLLGSHGGHKLAAGFSVSQEKVEELKNRLLGIAQAKLAQQKLKPTLKIDTEIDLSDLNFKLLHQLENLAPFGEANFQPVFVTKKIKIKDARLLGKDNQHLKLKIDSFDAIGFNMGNFYSQLSAEKPIDIAYNFEVNDWNNQRRIQLKLKDIKIKT